LLKPEKKITLQEDQHGYIYKFLALIRLHNSDRRCSLWRTRWSWRSSHAWGG